MSSALHQTHGTPVKAVVKLGGAAITIKSSHETLNREVLATCCQQLAEVVKRADIHPTSSTELAPLVVVHGAGSFGHFQAKQYGVARGGLEDSVKREGFAKTRLSVLQLNQHVVSGLINEGVPAVGLSPCNSWMTAGGGEAVVQDGCAMVAEALHVGLLPVLHGDAVIDRTQGCSILSGDTIIRKIAECFQPQYVVFLTNVDGIFDKPPEEEDARLLKLIELQEDGSWFSTDLIGELKLASASNDVTGGIQTKVQEALHVAAMGVVVLIAKAGTDDALLACLHGPMAVGMTTKSGSRWRGTIVQRAAKTQCGHVGMGDASC